MDFAKKVSTLFIAIIYGYIWWQVLSPVSVVPVGPYSYMIMFFASVILGCVLIVAQIDDDTGYDGRAITTLSGEVVPEIREPPEEMRKERTMQTWVRAGKTVFLFLAVFLLIFWIKLTAVGIPKDWLDKGYSFLIYMFAYMASGKHHAYINQSISSGDYAYVTGQMAGTVVRYAYISEPGLLVIPYAGFILWVVRGHRLLRAFRDYD